VNIKSQILQEAQHKDNKEGLNICRRLLAGSQLCFALNSVIWNNL